jgi:hypothetical protein
MRLRVLSTKPPTPSIFSQPRKSNDNVTHECFTISLVAEIRAQSVDEEEWYGGKPGTAAGLSFCLLALFRPHY